MTCALESAAVQAAFAAFRQACARRNPIKARSQHCETALGALKGHARHTHQRILQVGRDHIQISAVEGDEMQGFVRAWGRAAGI